MMRRRGGPGVMSTMARTAVVAGTATAVSNKVTASGQAKAAAAQQEQAEAQAAQANLTQMQEQVAALQAQQVQAAAAAGAGDVMGQLQQLAQLKEAGMLTEEEFSAAKGKLLAG